MSMDLMGIKPEELIGGVEYAGVATYIASNENVGTTLFVLTMSERLVGWDYYPGIG